MYIPIINYSRINKEVVIAVLKTFRLLEEISELQKNLINILAFGRDFYHKGTCAPNSPSISKS